MLLDTDNLEVAGLHTQIDHDPLKVTEVHITLHVQRIVIIGIDGEVLKQQVRVLDAYRVVVEA